MRSVVIRGPSDFGVMEMDSPTPGPGELLIHPLYAGICGTDLELLDGSMLYLREGRATYPVYPGHEWVGEVRGVGVDVTGFSEGDLVVGEVSMGCGRCAMCSAGHYHRCEERHEAGLFGVPGALREEMVFPARAAHLVPPGVEPRDAALTEPLAVAFQSVCKAGLVPGQPVLIVGVGTIGMLQGLVAKAVWGAEVFVASDNPRRAEIAVGLGMQIHQPGRTYPRILEAAGSAEAITVALDALEPGGRLILTGLTGTDLVGIPTDQIVARDQEISGSLGSPGVWPEVLELLRTHAVHPAQLVTHEFDLDEFPRAIELLHQRHPDTGKVLIRMRKET